MPEGSDPSLAADPVATVAEVIERLTAMEGVTAAGSPDARSGIHWFSHLYLVITRNVQAKITGGRFFADNEFLTALDVAFANRYLDAVRVHVRGEHPPEVWRMLFAVPEDGEILPVQLAMAGVNAHINLDLAFAVVNACRALGRGEIDDGGQKADYDKVNAIFAEEMDELLDQLARGYATPTQVQLARQSLLERLANEIVVLARRMAWENARYLWTLEPGSGAWRAHERVMDDAATVLSRAMLVNLPG
jgi:uncharacterized protein DUF5995